MSDFADMLKAMANVPKQDINPENGSVTSLGGTLIKRRDVQKMVENVPTGPSEPRGPSGPSGLDGVEDLLEDLTSDDANKIVEEIQDSSDDSVLPSQDAYLKMMGVERTEKPITENNSNSQPDIIKVEELINENEVMQSYINMIDDDLY